MTVRCSISLARHRRRTISRALGLASLIALATSTAVPTPVAAASAVTVSGSVRDANGNALANVLVFTDLGALVGSATDTDGNFSFPITTSSPTLDVLAFFDANGDPVSCCTTDGLAFSARTTIDPSASSTINITIPSRVQHTVSVVDGDAQPLAGVAIDSTIAGPELTLGTSLNWTTSSQTHWASSNPSLCTTDFSGSCGFKTFSSFVDPAHPGTISIKSGQTASSHPNGNLSGSAPLALLSTTITTSQALPEFVIHGVVRDVSGASVAHARVRTSQGSTATSSSDGSYAVYVLASTDVTVGAYAAIDPTTFALSEPPFSATALADLDLPCAGLPQVGPDGNQAPCEVIGTTVRKPIAHDDVIDLGLPAIRTHAVHVENAGATAIADANVILNGGVQHAEATDSEGVVTRHIYAPGWVPIPWSTCVTDSSGDCSLRALAETADSSLSAWAFKGMTFGGGSITVDAYGTVDRLSDPLTTIRTAFWTNASQGTVAGDVVVAVTQPDPEHPTGRALSDVTIAPAPVLPSGSVSPAGELSYTVTDVPVGGTQDVVVALPAGSAPSAVLKDTPSGLVDVSSLATITGDTVVMHLTDGGFGDEDGVANGVIVDPVIPVRSAVAVTATLTKPTTIYGQRTVLRTTTILSTGMRAAGGTITVTDGATTLGSGTVTRTGSLNVALPTLTAGTHTLTITYTGTSGSGSTTVPVTVNPATTRAIIRGPSSATPGSPVTFTARAWTLAPGRGIPTGTVTFTDGTTILGTVALDTAGNAALTTSALGFGAHTITATYNGSPNHTTSLKARTIAIK